MMMMTICRHDRLPEYYECVHFDKVFYCTWLICSCFMFCTLSSTFFTSISRKFLCEASFSLKSATCSPVRSYVNAKNSFYTYLCLQSQNGLQFLPVLSPIHSNRQKYIRDNNMAFLAHPATSLFVSRPVTIKQVIIIMQAVFAIFKYCFWKGSLLLYESWR